MSDRERRAEVEAVARVVRSQSRDTYDAERVARAAIAALDRVRDARGDDEAWIEVEHGDVQRTHPVVPRLPNGRYYRARARSPQGEDHEAGIEAAAKVLRGGGDLSWRVPAREAIAAYLSRVSPARDGTVAVEDVAEFIERYPERWGHGPSRLAADIRAHFGSASTTDQHRGEKP